MEKSESLLARIISRGYGLPSSISHQTFHNFYERDILANDDEDHKDLIRQKVRSLMFSCILSRKWKIASIFGSVDLDVKNLG